MKLYCNSALGSAANAAPEMQAESLGWRGRKLEVACPLEGCVRSDNSRQATSAHTMGTDNIVTTSAISLALGCKLIPNAATISMILS